MQPIYTRAVSGLQAAQQTMDIVANNLANSNTPGFDAALPDIADLVYQTVDPRDLLSGVATTPVGVGAQVDATPRSQIPGPPQTTNNPLDVVIAGGGYLQVQQANGQAAYTRAGMIRVDAQGRLNVQGMLLQPPITIPAGATDPTIQADGVVKVNSFGSPLAIGQIQLARFANEQGLQARDGTLLLPSADSGPPILGTPGQPGFGTLQTGMIEGARVDLSREMAAMIIAERAFGLNSRTLQTVDRMLGDVTKR